MSKEVETGSVFCWHESQEGVRTAVRSAVRLLHFCTVFEGVRPSLLLPYGALNLAQFSRDVRTAGTCCTVHLILAQILRKVQGHLMLVRSAGTDCCMVCSTT